MGKGDYDIFRDTHHLIGRQGSGFIVIICQPASGKGGRVEGGVFNEGVTWYRQNDI